MKRLKKSDERGAAMVEYAVLLGGVAIMVLIGMQMLGGTVRDTFAELDASISIAQDEPAAVEAAVAQGAALGPVPGPPCPNKWDLIPNNLQKKKGQDVDYNGDGLICKKQIPGNGKGNTGNNQNIKDNNK